MKQWISFVRNTMLACAMVVPAAQAATFANGADVSWVSQQEKAGYAFYNSNGIKTDPFVLLRNSQINAIRLRVWVNPTDGWNNGADVLYKAKRAVAQGLTEAQTDLAALPNPDPEPSGDNEVPHARAVHPQPQNAAVSLRRPTNAPIDAYGRRTRR